MSIEIPLLQKQTPFGLVSDPRIAVTVITPAGPRAFRFLIDTGADFSIAPRRLAQEAGLDWTALPEARIMGVEQGSLPARLGSLQIRIQDSALTVRCLFPDSARGPFILGRADFLDHFVLIMDQRRQRIVLDEYQ